MIRFLNRKFLVAIFVYFLILKVITDNKETQNARHS